MSTLFEKIILRELPAEILFEDDLCIAVRDISPQAPFHALVIPKKPIPRIEMAKSEDSNLLGHLLFSASQLAKRQKLDQGFRIVVNNGLHGGESVPHLHVHLLGGRQMKWPPG